MEAAIKVDRWMIVEIEAKALLQLVHYISVSSDVGVHISKANYLQHEPYIAIQQLSRKSFRSKNMIPLQFYVYKMMVGGKPKSKVVEEQLGWFQVIIYSDAKEW